VVGVATHRVGITDQFTVGGRLELAGDRANLGGTLQLAPQHSGILGASYAVSTSRIAGRGQLGLFAVRHRSANFAVGGLVERRSADFVDVSDIAGLPRLRQRDMVYASWSARARWSLGAQWLRVGYSNGELTIGSASWSWSPLPRLSLTMSLMRTSFDGDRDTMGSLFVSVPFWRRSYVSGSLERMDSADGAENHTMVQFGRNLAQNESWGYDARVSQTGTDSSLAWRGVFQSERGQLGLSAEDSTHGKLASAYLRGGIAMAGGSVALSRRLDSSFAIVQVADFPDVQLYSNGQPTVRTNGSGRAVLPSLTPFIANVLSFEPNDLPLDAVVTDNRLQLKLANRMGAYATMPVGRELSATLTLLDAAGRPVPAGASILLEGRETIHYVGRDGFAFISGLARDALQHLRVFGEDFECHALVRLPPDFSSGSTLGSITCE
jgi:outer membrane usher protein